MGKQQFLVVMLSICDYIQELDGTNYVFGTILCLRFKHVFFKGHFSKANTLSVGPVHCSQDLQTSFFNKTFITNESHNTIHTFKNYFVTVFSVFSKINDIQTYLSVKFKLYPHCFFLSHPICNIAVKNLEAPIPNA